MAKIHCCDRCGAEIQYLTMAQLTFGFQGSTGDLILTGGDIRCFACARDFDAWLGPRSEKEGNRRSRKNAKIYGQENGW